MIDFPVKMRAKPTLTLNAIDTEPNPGTSYPVTLGASYSTTRQTGMFVNRVSGTWGTEYGLMMLLRDNTSYIRADSEL